MYPSHRVWCFLSHLFFFLTIPNVTGTLLLLRKNWEKKKNSVVDDDKELHGSWVHSRVYSKGAYYQGLGWVYILSGPWADATASKTLVSLVLGQESTSGSTVGPQTTGLLPGSQIDVAPARPLDVTWKIRLCHGSISGSTARTKICRPASRGLSPSRSLVGKTASEPLLRTRARIQGCFKIQNWTTVDGPASWSTNGLVFCWVPGQLWVLIDHC